MSRDQAEYARAIAVTRHLFPDYLADWIVGTLVETHSLPSLIDHQNRIADSVLVLARTRSDDRGTPPGWRLERAAELTSQLEKRLEKVVDPPMSVLLNLAALHVSITREEREQSCHSQLAVQLQENADLARKLFDELNDEVVEVDLPEDEPAADHS